MNEQDYMKITSKIDESYVNEYKDITEKHVISIRKRIRTCVLVAAAVAIMVPATVFAGKRLSHREQVSIYYGEQGAKMIEDSMLASGYTLENGKVRLTVDVQMCDGNFAEIVYTLTALTEDAKDHIKSLDLYQKRTYTDTGEWVWPAGGCGASIGDCDNDNEITWSVSYAVKEPFVDSSRPTRLQFLEWKDTGEPDGHGGHTNFEDFTYFEGIYIDLLSEPNVPTKTLRSPEGKELTLSPYGVSCLEDTCLDDEDWVSIPIHRFDVISKNGEHFDIYSATCFGGLSAGGGITVTTEGEESYIVIGDLGKGDFSFRFGTAFNIDNISGVEINGVKYMEE